MHFYVFVFIMDQAFYVPAASLRRTLVQVKLHSAKTVLYDGAPMETPGTMVPAARVSFSLWC